MRVFLDAPEGVIALSEMQSEDWRGNSMRGFPVGSVRIVGNPETLEIRRCVYRRLRGIVGHPDNGAAATSIVRIARFPRGDGICRSPRRGGEATAQRSSYFPAQKSKSHF
jgi:hypothetical protein